MGKKRRHRQQPSSPPKAVLSDNERIWLFVFRIAELQAKQYYKQFRVVTTKRQGEVVNYHAPVDEELFLSFLATYRLFHQKSEPTYIGGSGQRGIVDILRDALGLANEPTLLARITAIEQEFAQRGQIEYHITGEDGNTVLKVLDEEGIFHLWMDTRYFHSDADGLQFFYQLPASTIEASRRAFELLLVPWVRRIEAHLPLVKYVLERHLLPQGRVTITFRRQHHQAEIPSNGKKLIIKNVID
jgi:hypothetical protein